MNIAETMHRVLFCPFTFALAELLISLELLMYEHFWQLLSTRPVLGSEGCRAVCEAAPVLGAGREGMDNMALSGSVVVRVVCHSELDWACLGCSPI